jgi:hypothetical protein
MSFRVEEAKKKLPVSLPRQRDLASASCGKELCRKDANCASAAVKVGNQTISVSFYPWLVGGGNYKAIRGIHYFA